MENLRNQSAILDFRKGNEPKDVTWKEFFDAGLELWRYGNLLCSKYYIDKEQICIQMAKKRTFIESYREYKNVQNKIKNNDGLIDDDLNIAIYEEDKRALVCIKNLQDIFDKYFRAELENFDKCILTCSVHYPKENGWFSFFSRHRCWRRCEGTMNTHCKLIIRDMEGYFKEMEQNYKQEIKL